MTKRLPKWTFAVFPLVLASAAYGSTGANSTRSSDDPKMPRHPSPSLIGDRRANAPIIMTIVTVGRHHLQTAGDFRHQSPLHQLGTRMTSARFNQAASALMTTRRRSARSEEHTSELQSLMRISYAAFCLKKKNKNKTTHK